MLSLKNNLVYISLSFYFLFYLIAFSYGNFSAPDRQTYFDLLDNPLQSLQLHVEPAILYFSFILKELGFSTKFVLYLLAALISVFSLMTTYLLTRKYKESFVLIYPMVFFAGLSILSFAQLRPALAIWLGLLFYTLYLRRGGVKWLLLPLATIAIHKVMIPFSVLVIAYHLFKIPFKYLFPAISLVSIAVTFFAPLIIQALGLSEYYLVYFSDAKNAIFFSPLILAYFLLMITSIFVFDKHEKKENEIIYLSLPIAIVAYVASIDLFVKFIFPFIILTWIYVLRSVYTKYLLKLSAPLAFVCCLFLILISLAYGIVRY